MNQLEVPVGGRSGYGIISFIREQIALRMRHTDNPLILRVDPLLNTKSQIAEQMAEDLNRQLTALDMICCSGL